tara:strand:- start:40 stop:222 length:183 start_codon:yes stop_codon:yes gene_type:complete
MTKIDASKKSKNVSNVPYMPRMKITPKINSGKINFFDDLMVLLNRSIIRKKKAIQNRISI